MWRRAAAELHAEVRVLTGTLIEFRRGSTTAFVSRQTTPFADPVSRELADDKPLAYRILSEAGLPVPAQVVLNADDHKSAATFAADVGVPLIVKPARGRGGAGVVGHVCTDTQLARALLHAGKMSRQVMIERQVPGDSYRILVLDGDVIGVVRRERPAITGDGRSTVADLLFREYERRLTTEGPAGLKPLRIDLDCLFTLAYSGLRLDSVLPANQAVVFKTATNYNGRDQTQALAVPYPAGLVDSARRAAAALGARLGGVDVVTTEPDKPLEEVGGVVLEVNAVPGLFHHYNVSDSTAAPDVAVAILGKLLAGSATDES
jgi:D-alanine-D-alanine ligase-like ATP-grasp enzyme